MNIDFVEEPENELVNRKNLYINPDSELSLTLSRVQDALDSDGYPLDRSKYKYVKGKLCKFQIELISSPDIALLIKRTNSLKKLNININKMKWDFNESGGSYFMKIGKIQDKDLHIVVASFHTVPSSDDNEKIRDIRDKAIRNESDDDESSLNLNPVEEETKDDGEILLPMKSLSDITISSPIQKSELSSVRVGSSSITASQNTKLVRPSIQRISASVKASASAQPQPQQIKQPVQESSSSISMKDIQARHNRAIGRSGANTSIIRPVVTALQYTQNAQSVSSSSSSSSSTRPVPARQTTFLASQHPIQSRPPVTHPIQQTHPVTNTPPISSVVAMPKPNIILYQQRQLQALVGGNKPVTSFKIRG